MYSALRAATVVFEDFRDDGASVLLRPYSAATLLRERMAALLS